MAMRGFVAAPARSAPEGSMDTSHTATKAKRSPQPAPCLPKPQIVRVDDECVLEYIDLPPSTASRDRRDQATLVLLHGAPGTYHDFRYLIPHLQQQLPTARIVGINFPGFGGSTVDSSRAIELLHAQRSAQLTLKALHKLVAEDENVFLVGHSFGGHAALSIAALNLSHKSKVSALRIKGLVLLAAAGMKPHRVLQPHRTALLVHALQMSPSPLCSVISFDIKLFYTVVLPFPSSLPTSHFVAGVVRAGTTDFTAVRRHVTAVRSAGVPSLSAWSRDDAFMEDEIPSALAHALGSSKQIAFASAGHNIQKTRAIDVAVEMKLWIRQVLECEDATHSSHTRIESRL